MTNETPATIRARLAEAEKAQHYWHQKWEAEREQNRRLVECAQRISVWNEDIHGSPRSPGLDNLLATVSDLTAAAAEDEVKS